MGIWDSNFKQLVNANPQEFADWLLEGAQVIRELSEHLNRTLDIDILYETLLDEEQVGLHIEFQRYSDKEMARRVAEYNVFSSGKFDIPVVSFVLYLKKDGTIVESPLVRRLKNGRQLSRIDFVVVKLWEVPTQTLRETGLVGLLPLLPLTKEGATQEVVEEVITKLVAAKEEQAHLFPIAFTLSSLALDTSEDKEWLIRRFRMLEDMLQETVIYQYILQQGVAKGEQQELQDFRQVLLGFVQAKFPDLVSFASAKVDIITSIDTMKDLALKMVTAQTSDEIRKLLRNSSSKKNENKH